MGNPQKLEPDKFYHVFSRGNNRENIFFEDRNYSYFLSLWQNYTREIADTYAYCLLKNHFHALIKTKPGDKAEPSRQFSNLFNSYAKSVNAAYARTGSLFHRPFGRNEVDSESYLVQVVLYIHFNPQKHMFVSSCTAYPHSSYNVLVSDRQTFLKRDDVFQWFGSRARFIQVHEMYSAESDLNQLADFDDETG